MRNKIFALFLLFALLLPGAINEIHTGAAVEVPIILYHKVSKDRGQLGEFCIHPEEFEADLLFLKDNGFEAVTMRNLIDFVAGEGDLPEKPVVLSFDDGYFSDYHYVFPLLLEYDVPIVSAIIGKVTDDYTAEGRGDINYPHLIWPQIQEMAASGLVEFQNHGYDLHCVKTGMGAKQRRGESEADYTKRLDRDLNRLQDRAREMLGEAPTTFAYPFGAKSPSSDTVLKHLGFSASLTSGSRKNRIVLGDENCLFNLGRINRSHGGSIEAILGG